MTHEQSLVAVEGTAFSGKTTLVGELGMQGWAVVPELSVSHRDGAGFPPLPNDSASADTVDRWFLAAEAGRVVPDGVPAVLDRCALSFVAHVAARAVCGGPVVSSAVLRELASCVEKGTLPAPLVVVLVPSVRQQALRRRARGPAAARLVPEQTSLFLAAAAVAYQRFAASTGRWVLVLDADQPVEQLVSLVVEWASTRSSSVNAYIRGLMAAADR